MNLINIYCQTTRCPYLLYFANTVLKPVEVLYTGKHSPPFYFLPFFPRCQRVNIRTARFPRYKIISLNSTVSGQIQDGGNCFLSVENGAKITLNTVSNSEIFKNQCSELISQETSLFILESDTLYILTGSTLSSLYLVYTLQYISYHTKHIAYLRDYRLKKKRMLIISILM